MEDGDANTAVQVKDGNFHDENVPRNLGLT